MKFPSTLRISSVSVPHLFEIHKTESEKQLGHLGKNGSFSGVIGMLQRGEADLGVGGIGMLYERLDVVDFSHTYMIKD
ncbi:hypothetical protein CEXT_468951 [Caerostris extrusa]|uniref:Ionotropic glutamate receptor L-glutamate and glycine-binding domain-containing protein n=1 Tax=Caerostris extrusa TaxID=172846 RepID=A0AAV4UAG6_CAEEX|nr:hypothetical protein CEXT_468951 [Caerostris extrusa]